MEGCESFRNCHFRGTGLQLQKDGVRLCCA